MGGALRPQALHLARGQRSASGPWRYINRGHARQGIHFEIVAFHTPPTKAAERFTIMCQRFAAVPGLPQLLEGLLDRSPDAVTIGQRLQPEGRTPPAQLTHAIMLMDGIPGPSPDPALKSPPAEILVDHLLHRPC